MNTAVSGPSPTTVVGNIIGVKCSAAGACIASKNVEERAGVCACLYLAAFSFLSLA